MKRSLASVGLACSLALISADAWAQKSTAKSAQAPLEQTLSGDAKVAYDSAQILSNNGDFAGALAKYQQAYDLSKDARLLFNMAICERSLHAWARMQSLLRQYEREAGSALSNADKAEVEGALAVIQNLVGTIELTVSEPGATVAIDGEQVGTAPLADPIALDLGKHTIIVSKSGFDTVTQTAVIEGGNETAITIALVAQRHIAQLRVTSDEHATLSVDDKVEGLGRFEGQLEPGTHHLLVTESGKVPYKADIDLRDGETRTVQVTLEDEKHGATIWPWIVSGAVVAAGAVVGGYFLFKTKDEPGSPTAGSLSPGIVTLSSFR